ncbi:recombinase family protein [Massilia niabensis]|uniref:Recombinase family protein n=1 Tax=Massilia niabensis TaxID=544910 RepID=A0ABW0LDP9_9BURK
MAVFGYGISTTKEVHSEHERIQIERAGYQIDHWYADDEASYLLSSSHRAKFSVLLNNISSGETLAVATLDRLGRDLQDVGATIRMLAARKVELIILQIGELNLTSSSGELVLAMLAALAEMDGGAPAKRTASLISGPKTAGRTLGRPRSTTEEQRVEMVRQHREGKGVSISALARAHGISRASVMRIVRPAVASH